MPPTQKVPNPGTEEHLSPTRGQGNRQGSSARKPIGSGEADARQEKSILTGRWTDVLWAGSSFQYVEGVRIDDATKDQARQLVEAHKRGKLLIEAAIQRLKKAKTTPDDLAKKYFSVKSSAPKDQVIVNKLIAHFVEMDSQFPSMTYEIDSKHDSELPYLKDDFCNWVRKRFGGKEKLRPYAWVGAATSLFGIGDIHIYWPSFSRRSLNLQAKTLVHEQAHYSIHADDEAYYWDEKKFKSLSQDDQLDNADSYAMFALDAYERQKESSKVQCDNTQSHTDGSKQSCGNSCIITKGHPGKHQCILGHVW